MMTHFYKRYIG